MSNGSLDVPRFTTKIALVIRDDLATWQKLNVTPADAQSMKTIYERAMQRAVPMSIFVEEMFKTGHDAANRATVRASSPKSINVVGLALREEKKLVDKITNGATLHP